MARLGAVLEVLQVFICEPRRAPRDWWKRELQRVLPPHRSFGGHVHSGEGVAAARAVDVRVVWGRVRCWGAFSSLRLAPRVRHRRDSPHKSHRWHGEELSVEQQIKNHIARESFGLGEVQIKPGAKKGDAGGAAGWVEKAELLAA